MKGDNQMKNVLLRAVSISFLAAILMFGSISYAAASGSLQVVILVCSGNEGGTLTVGLASSSAGAPIVPVGSNCSQGLADVLNAGFKLVSSTWDMGGYAFILNR